ncbi:hypothetical protein BpHYR1_039513 [Brachionus plicatilis]|uniref:Uncharacterized protein n=1 Tax=Brachionus plicatilis TaxID=10195 RepID=A0A3M7R2J2_BRAPC|nr:hypothetical protein BpHYR1_039513 [Brachionus plicatilis]
MENFHFFYCDQIIRIRYKEQEYKSCFGKILKIVAFNIIFYPLGPKVYLKTRISELLKKLIYYIKIEICATLKWINCGCD